MNVITVIFGQKPPKPYYSKLFALAVYKNFDWQFVNDKVREMRGKSARIFPIHFVPLSLPLSCS